jgi:hypothetical protein
MIVNDYSNNWLNFEVKLNEQHYLLEEQALMLSYRSSLFSEDVELLSEGVSDSIKKFWKNLKEKIKELWRRFRLKVDELVKSNKSWLEKYKNQLLNVNLNDFEYEIYPYWNGASELQKAKVPNFNHLNSQFMESLESEDAFREKFFRQFNDLDQGDNFVDSLKDHFRGGSEQTFKGSAIKSRIPGIIDYCQKYDGIIKDLNRDYNNIEKSVESAEREAARASNSLPASKQAEKSEDKTANKSDGGLKEDMDFGLTFEQLLSESEFDKKAKELHSNANDNKKLSDNTNKFKDNVDKDSTKTDDGKDPDNSTRDNADKNLAKYKLYVTFCQKVLGAKQTIYEERYNAYMKLLRQLVKEKKGKGNSSVKGTVNELESDKAYYEKLNDEQQKKVDDLVKKKEESLNWIKKYSVGKELEKIQNDPKYKEAKEKYDKAEAELEKFRKSS